MTENIVTKDHGSDDVGAKGANKRTFMGLLHKCQIRGGDCVELV